MLKIKSFLNNEPVFIISALCALATMFVIPPDKEYLGYIDFRVLCLLMCLMAVVAGLKSIGVFNWLTYHLLKRIKSGNLLGATLVMLVFFSSMLVTNDVALIIFVPFTIALLTNLNLKKHLILITVLQTVAANLGSMATPVGNPQNLFLYSVYQLTAGDFFKITFPLTALSFIVLLLTALPVLPKALTCQQPEKEEINSKSHLLIYIALFVLSLLSVFRVIPYQLTTVITVIVFLISDRNRFKEIDFSLLATFVCFFIISENLGRIDSVNLFLEQLLEKNTLLTAIGASQVISNVPAAVLLSGFTEKWQDLLAGVNIGGLGTPIASLASLISLKFYLKTANSEPLKFFLVFTLANLAGLAILITFSLLK